VSGFLGSAGVFSPVFDWPSENMEYPKISGIYNDGSARMSRIGFMKPSQSRSLRIQMNSILTIILEIFVNVTQVRITWNRKLLALFDL
jgi:hypothetical protein